MSRDTHTVTAKQLAELVDAAFEHGENRLVNRVTERVTVDVVRHLQSVGLLDRNGYAKPVIFRPRAECYPPLVLE